MAVVAVDLVGAVEVEVVGGGWGPWTMSGVLSVAVVGE